MQVGLGISASGADVERLQRILASQGHAIDPGERDRGEFGPSTLAALRAFQAQHKLPQTAALDAATLAVLLQVEQTAASNVTQGTAPALPVAVDPGRGSVTGKLVDGDGDPIARTAVALVAKQLRTETALGKAVTDDAGQYRISYVRKSALNLLARATDAAGKVIATSAIVYAAPAQAEIDLTTAPEGVVRAPSQLTTLQKTVTAALDGVALSDLRENKDQHDVTFVAQETSATFANVANLYIAHVLATKNKLRDDTLFGLLVNGTPPNLAAALADLPDAGIDDTFTAQVMNGVLAQSRAALDKTLGDAVAAGVLPASYAAVQQAELSTLDALRVASVGSTRYIRGKTPLNGLLAAGTVAQNVQTAFVQAYAANGGRLGPTWKTLRADKSLTKADLTTLNTVLSAGELLTGNLLLVKDTLKRLADKSLASLKDLALLNEADWEARIRSVDPDATSIPQVLPNDTAADRIARFAKALFQRFVGRYPTTAFVGGLSETKSSSFATKIDLIAVLTANPKLNIRRTNIDQFVATNKLKITPATLTELKTIQRLYRVSPHYATVEALNDAGYTSAQRICLTGQKPFLAHMTQALGSAVLAKMAYARAQMIYATSLTALGRYNLQFNSVKVASVASGVPTAGTLASLPDLQALFGSLDYFEYDDCQSVLGPAAYLVDLLQFLSIAATPLPGSVPPVSTIATARDALLLRRPDIQYVALDCNNTNIVIPYIDLVNEVLEAAIAPAAIARPTVVDTSGSTAERRALPQQTQPLVAAAAYGATAAAMFPLSLPFDVIFARTAAYVAALGTTRTALMRLFPNVANPAAIAGAAIGLNPAMQAVINQANTATPWTRWGLAQNPTQVIDPKTRLPYSPTPTDWVAAFNKVPVLLNRTGLSLQQLAQLLEAVWVTQSGVTLQLGSTTIAGEQIASADADLMTFTGLTGAVLDRANRFLRLWNATGLNMWELDWALAQAGGGALDDVFLAFLAGAMDVAKTLNLPLQEVLTFWGTIQTRDVTSHLGDEDVVIPSTYSEVFANPTILASWGALFGNASALSGAEIVYPASANPSPAQLQPLNGISAALGLSADDISAILEASGAANALTLPTLTVLLRYARLARALSLGVPDPIPDLILWIALTGASPFGGTPADTTEFLRRLAVLRRTSLAVQDLDYLLRGQSAAESALAFTSTQSTAVLQSIRDAIAKAVAANALSLTSVSNGAPIAIGTAKPHGLATGDRVLVSGVSANTAANGIFTITVTGPAAFTLNGSTGNAAWTGGGTVTANLDATVQVIVVTALATAAGVTADVVTPVLNKTGVLPLDAATIASLLAQSTVDPTHYPALVAAATQVDKAGALFTALAPSSAAFAFAVANAATFGWLEPSALPLTPVTASPYAAFEALLQALKLQQRQVARSPKLFDVLGQWLLPGGLPADVPTAIGGPTLTIAGATNASPIVITTTAPHGLVTAEQVTISLVQGNTAANGTFTITVTGPTTFTLNGSTGNGAWTTGGVVTLPGALSLSQALNVSIADVTKIATALGAGAPSLDPAHRAGTLADIAVLTRIANALDVVARYRISAATLLLLAAAAPGQDSAEAAMGAYQARYQQSAWFAAVQPVEDGLRQARRDALVAYLLGPGPVTSPGAQFLTTDDIFNYYLIDPEMCACGETTRLLQPSLAIQQLVQQCFLNLTINATVDMTDPRWKEWSWRQRYQLWRANREVFLYPENFLLPETRGDASPFFTDLERDLRQTNCDADAAEAAFQDYLRKLVGVSRLVVAAHYNQIKPDGSEVLHVFGRTRASPPQWFYRTRTSPTPGNGTWSAWTALNLDIASVHLLPVIWDRRLHLVWPVFKEESQRSQDQTMPKQGGQDVPPPRKFWAVEFAMSEFSAGQWQPKQTFAEKMFLRKADPVIGDLPPQAFTFRAYQDNATMNLLIDAYWNVDNWEVIPAGRATLAMPEAPLAVSEVEAWFYTLLPPASDVDLAQEPSYALITPSTQSDTLTTPLSYGFSAQDLRYGDYWSANPGAVPLNVLCQTTSTGQPVNATLLAHIVNPCIVIPFQESVFDSLDPFFVTDPGRCWLVQPHYYTNSSSPIELDPLGYARQWQTRYEFETFYHPYARTFLRELEIGGIPQLMSRNLQLNPQTVRGWPTTFDFNALYGPTGLVATPYPGAAAAPDSGETWLDFRGGSSGAYSLYNWEIFYHAPMFIASLLMQNNQFQDAMTWLEYIFNPTDNSAGPSPQRFWEMAPFNAMNAADWANQQVQILLVTLAADTQQGIADPATANAILAWMADPFDPDKVASTRISAYGKATVMKFLDNLIAWGDSLYAQYTAETVNHAEQLYIVADMILGPAPELVRAPTPEGPPPTYASLQGAHLDLFSNVLVNIENVVIAPEPPQSVVQGTGTFPTLPSLLFGIPPNDQLLGYWTKVWQRLYNIRHCLNLQGVAQPLPLYGPLLNPLQLIAQQAAGTSAFGAAVTAPIYRFAIYLQHAVELANEVRSYGELILSALEKQDAEALSTLRATQELDIQTRMLDVKTEQVAEAQDQITALQNQQAMVQIRYDFYSKVAFLNAWEAEALALQTEALIFNGAAIILDLTAGTAHALPTVNAGVAGPFGSPNITILIGGENVGNAADSGASALRGLAGVLGESAGMAATMGGYQRRQDEWTLQANLANAELTQIASQVTAANDRLAIAQKELSIQQAQITNAQAVKDFLTNKYTNAQLYNWFLTQVTSVYTQAYQLAFSLALQAQAAYQYELGRPTDQFIQFAYWDSQHKGLTAGDSLLFDLRRMEAQYLANNPREQELTKNISLALTQPLALVRLLQTGSGTITLDETLFDHDHPGQYFRRLRFVALTFCCVVGPYTNVNATLELGSAVVRTVAPSAGFQPWIWANSASNTDPAIGASLPMTAVPVIATSSGQNDGGLFDVNLRDERWLPFEGQGAVSTWNLTLDPRDNDFDLSTVTDVILHIRYSARSGGDAEAVRTALKPDKARTVLISVRSTFGDAYYRFFNPADSTATAQTLTLPLTSSVFPFSNLGQPKMTGATIIIALSKPMSNALTTAMGSGLEIDGTFGQTGTTTPAAVKLTPVTGTAAGGGEIAALSSGSVALATPVAPAGFTLTVPQASVPPALQVQVNGQNRLDGGQIDDIVLLINYEID
jgi:peptidoglycan hydrolase-like protein with peptidoglycan-binding domain